MFPGRMRQGVRHVIGQDQEAFDQGRDQHDDHRKRDIGNQVPEPPADGDEAEEGDDRGQRGGQNRHEHALRRVLGGVHGGLPQPSRSEIGVFAHDNRVIHHDPQRDDQRE